MAFTGNYFNLAVFYTVYKTVRIVDSPAPKSSKIAG